MRAFNVRARLLRLGAALLLMTGVLAAPVAGAADWPSFGGNLQNTDPLFVNATGFNFHLTAGSPARGLGVAAWCPAVDFDGVARSGACSAGAYQN